MTGGNGLTYSYASFNKPTQITRGTTTIGFAHDPEHQRFRQVAPGKEVLYLNAGGVLVEKITGSGGAITWNNYLFVAGKMVGMRVERSSGAVDTRYFHRDHLGSVAILTSTKGEILEMAADRLDNDGKQITNLIKGKVIKIVIRHRIGELMLEFEDGGRLFINSKENDLDFSVTGGRNDAA